MHKFIFILIPLLAMGCRTVVGLGDEPEWTTDDFNSDFDNNLGTESSDIIVTGTDPVTTRDTESDTGVNSGGDSNSSSGVDTETVDTNIIAGTDAGPGMETDSNTDIGSNTECAVTNSGIESCDGVDNNCDGTVDESFNFATDPQNCGGCGNDCMTKAELWPDFGEKLPANITGAECIDGHCEVSSCRQGFTDDSLFPYKDCQFSIKQVVTGDEHTCALFVDNSVQCWGYNSAGELGRDTGFTNYSNNPAPVTGLAIGEGVDVIQLTAGFKHTCALLSDSTILCWGHNYYGQLGRDTGDQTKQDLVESASLY